jgi:small subunit ribosomal protein S20
LPARKAARQSVKRRQRNLSVLRSTRTAVSGARRAIAAGDAEVAGTALRQAISVLDKAAKKGVLPKNNVSRRKSRLAALLNRTQRTAAT